MITTFVIGSATTYGLYKGVMYLTPNSNVVDFETFMRFEDVRSTLVTVGEYLKKHKSKKSLAEQHKLINRLLHDLDQLRQWRQHRFYRFFTYTGENKLIHQFKEEWIIFKVRIRVICGLNSLDLLG